MGIDASVTALMSLQRPGASIDGSNSITEAI
jgi:hypothetical protein